MNCTAQTAGAIAAHRREIVLRFLAAPSDLGYSGRVDAGRVLTWIDKAGYACAVGWTGRYCVTAYAGNVTFSRPVNIGDVVEVHARLVHTGRSSMHILVTVASGNPVSSTVVRATECWLIFVAVDDAGRPSDVPTVRSDTDSHRALQSLALEKISLRRRIESAMSSQAYTDDGTAPRKTLRLLAAPADANWGGNVHGGTVMRWIDEAAHAVATSWTRNPATVAVYIGGVRFYRPLRIGHLIDVDARLLHTGARSMHVSVHVRSTDLTTGSTELATHCLTVFVAVDQLGQATEIPKWVPHAAEDAALDAHARHLIALRGNVHTTT